MIVAIVAQGAGVLPVQEFRESVDAATAVSDYCAEYTPPKNTADYLGYDTGWASFQAPAQGKEWSYDFANPGLIQTDLPIVLAFIGAEKVTKGEQAVTVDAPDWGVVDYITTNPAFFAQGDLSLICGRVVGRYSSDGAVDLQVVEDDGSTDVVVTPVLSLPSNGGAWAYFAFDTNQTLRAGDNEYRLEARRDGATSLILRGVSMTLLRKAT